MNELGYLQAIILGAIQGLAEFLPISSSGHLALTQTWIGLKPDNHALLLFDVLVHLGTLLAVFLVFALPAKQFVAQLVTESKSSWTGRRTAWHIAILAIAATLPTAAIGLTFQSTFEEAFASKTTIGVCLIITGLLLAALGFVSRGKRGWRKLRWWEAAIVGVAQGLAIFPGISRSGATICMASYFGWRRQWAAQFSFLISAPAICGGVILKARDTLELTSEQLSALPLGPILAGTLVSFGVGVISLLLLLGMIRRAKLHYFSAYCLIVGVTVCFLA